MTNREFFEAVAGGKTNEEIVSHAITQLEKMNEANAKRKNKPSKKSLANEPIKAKIMEFIIGRNEICIASAVAEAVEITVQKASALLRQLATEGQLEQVEVKVPKKGKQKGYKVIVGE